MPIKKCVRCKESYSSDDMTPDAFGDSSTKMCDTCMYEIKQDDSRFTLVETSDYMGITFIFKSQLEELKRYWGDGNVTVLKVSKSN